jgi:hypothetical protein
MDQQPEGGYWQVKATIRFLPEKAVRQAKNFRAISEIGYGKMSG